MIAQHYIGSGRLWRTKHQSFDSACLEALLWISDVFEVKRSRLRIILLQKLNKGWARTSYKSFPLRKLRYKLSYLLAKDLAAGILVLICKQGNLPMLSLKISLERPKRKQALYRSAELELKGSHTHMDWISLGDFELHCESIFVSYV